MFRCRVLALGWWAALLALGLAGCATDADRFGAIAPAMQRFVDEREVSGIVTLVATKDSILHEAAVGTSDGRRALRTDDLFWIASMSKPMTAVAVAMLVEEGKLSFDDRVDKYVPEFKDLTVGGAPLARPILLRDLLNHTSGLAYNYAVTQPHWTLRQYVQQITSQPLRFQPGTNWYYSNAGFDVVGYIVQVASGMPLDVFMQKRLFDPLDMKDTSFWITPDTLNRYARAYAIDAETRALRETPCVGLNGTEVTDRGRPPLGAAGLFSTAQDVARFYQMMLNDGKVGDRVILQPESVARLIRPQIGALSPGNGLSWGYGFCLVADPEGMASNAMLSRGSFGHVGLYGTNSWADSRRGVIYILLLERGDLENYLDSPMRTQFQSLAARAIDVR